MIGFRLSAAIVAALASIALAAGAQGTTTTDPKKTPKAEETKDQTKAPPPKKAEPAPKKTEPAPKKATDADKKAAPKKAPAKKAPPKKVDERPKATGQGGTVQKYEAGKAPVLRDAKGNTFETSPDAYDVSSATAPPPKKK